MKKLQITCDNRNRCFAFCLLLSALCLLSGTLFAQKQQIIPLQTKVFTKNYTVNPKEILDVNTKFINVIFQEWDKNEIDFTATVSVKNATEKTFEQIISGVNITTNQSGKKTTYKLSLNYSGNSPIRNEKNCDITLLVKMPKDIFLEVESSFGNIELKNLFNDFKANVDFGNLNINNLSGNSNKVKITQGKLIIGQVSHLSLDASFSQITMNEVGILNLDSDFSTIKIDVVKHVNLSSKQDKISILNNIDKIEGTMSFGTLKIKSLKQTCVFTDFSFSKVTIDEVLKSFTNITFLSSQSTIALNVPEDQSFKFDYSGSFTKFRDENNIKLNEATFKASNNSTQMNGIYGKNNDSGKLVKIHASFGSVSLFER